jgi:molybdopterin adenylyltransferase
MKIVSINISEKKGSIKKAVNEAEITNTGIAGDAHTGNWHRQVSLLASESIENFTKQYGKKINYGEFAENLTTQGIDLTKVNILDCFRIGEVMLEVSQIGKSCHGTNCAIYQETGNCIMPKEGIFCRVLSAGKINVNDTIEFLPKTFHLKIITLSDRASGGEYEDRSGPIIREMAENFFLSKNRKLAVEITVIPDEAELLTKLCMDAKAKKTDFLITTGGTGVGKRDITPDTVRPMLDKEIPGIMDHIRLKYGADKPNALLSRSIAGIMEETQVYVIPGSTKAVTEYMTEILKTMEHLLYMLKGLDLH